MPSEFALYQPISSSWFLHVGPPMFGLPRHPFFPTPFMPVPPPNTFMMHPRFPMPAASPHGMISPVSHLLINSNDMSNSENIDSSNITPNSTGYERQSNGGVLSPVPESKFTS